MKYDKIKQEYWSIYRGVRYLISKWKCPDANTPVLIDKWNYYLLVFVDQFPEDINKELWFPKPQEKPRWNGDQYTWPEAWDGLEWHGGVTWVSVESPHPEHGYNLIKVGCDYSHLCDQGVSYTWECVERDAKNTIDSLLLVIPNLKTLEGKLCRNLED